MRNLILDYEFQFGHKPTFRNILSSFTFFPGFRAVTIMRIQLAFQRIGKMRLALFFSNINHLVTGSEICVGAEIGAPFLIRHPSGIVIGGGVKIGKHCTILQGVTIGEKYLEFPNGAYPIIEDAVQIGCNSSILGKVRIGAHSNIGAHSLILNDVETGKTVFGLH